MSQSQTMARILDAIKSQRWYFFKNKPKIIFDSDDGLIWANLDYFPYQKENGAEYYSHEVQPLLDAINKEGIDGFKGWEIPDSIDCLRNCYDYDKNLIKDKPNWFVKSWSFQSKNLDGSYRGYNGERVGFIIPYNSKFRRYGYDPFKEIEFFTENNLEPIFNDELVSELYPRRGMIFKLDDIWGQITQSNFNGSNTLLDYAASIQNLTGDLLNKFDTYTRIGAEILDELKKISPPNILVPNVKAVRTDIERIQDEAIKLESTLLEVDNLAELQRLKAEQRPPFNLVVEILKRKIIRVFEQVDFFNLHADFVRNACDALNLEFEFEGEFLKQFRIRDRLAHKILVNLIRYVKAGHLESTAEIILEHLQSYRHGLAGLYRGRRDEPSAEEIAAQIESLRKNLEEVTPKINNEDERNYVLNLPQYLHN